MVCLLYTSGLEVLKDTDSVEINDRVSSEHDLLDIELEDDATCQWIIQENDLLFLSYSPMPEFDISLVSISLFKVVPERLLPSDSNTSS